MRKLVKKPGKLLARSFANELRDARDRKATKRVEVREKGSRNGGRRAGNAANKGRECNSSLLGGRKSETSSLGAHGSRTEKRKGKRRRENWRGGCEQGAQVLSSTSLPRTRSMSARRRVAEPCAQPATLSPCAFGNSKLNVSRPRGVGGIRVAASCETVL